MISILPLPLSRRPFLERTGEKKGETAQGTELNAVAYTEIYLFIERQEEKRHMCIQTHTHPHPPLWKNEKDLSVFDSFLYITFFLFFLLEIKWEQEKLLWPFWAFALAVEHCVRLMNCERYLFSRRKTKFPKGKTNNNNKKKNQRIAAITCSSQGKFLV